jgi:hypothetical protein
MSDKKLTESKKESARDIMLKEIIDQLTIALPALKEKIGDKKFEKRIKKAARLLTEGIKTTAPVREPKAKAAVVKEAPAKAKAVALVKKATAKTRVVAPAKKASKAATTK